MNVKTGLKIAVVAGALAVAAGCATQTDNGAGSAAPGVAQTSCATAKDRASCKGNSCKGKSSRMKSSSEGDQM